MKYFVILSQGAYSDYDPEYYYGDREITQEELNKKSIEVGDSFMKEYLGFPERESTSKWAITGDKEKYNPKTGEVVYQPSESEYLEIMGKWLENEMGYEKVGDSPEINVYYDIPTSKNL